MQEDATNTLPQRRMSRYRSQRVPPTTSPHDAPPLPPAVPAETVDEPLMRSRSRYHSKSVSSPRRPTRDDGYDFPPPLAASAEAARANAEVQHQISPKSARSPKSPMEEAGLAYSGVATTQPEQRRCAAQRVDSGTTVQSADAHPNIDPGSAPLALQPSRSPPPTGELFPPMRPQTPPRIDGPPTSAQIRVTKSAAPLNTQGHKEEQGGGSRFFRMFRRKHTRHRSVEEKPTSQSLGTGTPAVGVDAPVSAVNAGERRVFVECGNSKLVYPVTPTTTSVDLIKSASNTMNEQINVKSAVMLEHFATVGVHRPLRRYEHIRDVMNSWDNDTQNTLLIVDPGVGRAENELNLIGAPKHKPSKERKWSLYYSHTVGKWNKRGITLKPDGQLTMLKDPKRPNEVVNICRLSDFDIYTPTPEKIKKKIKPPKKHCFAIKSQQKSSMFESATNFVHFFCTADPADAESFRAAIQGWRSWYLVNVMGEGTKNESKLEQTPMKSAASVEAGSRVHKRMDSVESHYQLGTFSNLVDMDQFNGDAAGRVGRPSQDQARQLQRNVTQKRAQQPSAFVVTAQLADDEPLAHLGRKLSVSGGRRPQTQGNDTVRRRDSTRAAAHQKPLIDLSSPSRESARQISTSHGPRPGHIGSGGLVDSATSPNDAAIDSQNRGRASMDVSALQSAAAYRPGTASNQAFTGEGLLASSQEGWGGGTRGRGVMDGSRATGPMVELSHSSHFAQGSLLQKVDRQHASQHPKIDRQRRFEMKTRTGEGY